MSLQDSEAITAFSLRFAVKWAFPFRKLANISTQNERATSVMSNRFRFKFIKLLEFSYTLTHVNHYKIRLECGADMPIFLEDVLILVNDCVYRAECNSTNTLGRLVFNRAVFLENFSEGDVVTFHCIMSVPGQVKAVFPYLDEGTVMHHIVDCECIVTKSSIQSHGYDAVREFEYSGKIPDFDVKMAISMIAEAHKRNNPLLKALCSEYLMDNITTENVIKILKHSIDSGTKLLSQKCVDFLAKERQEVLRD